MKLAEGADVGTTAAPGFAQPISVLSCALLGALTNVEAHAGKNQHVAVAKHLWRPDRVGPLEQVLLTWVLHLRPLEPDTGAFMDATKRARLNNRNAMASWVHLTLSDSRSLPDVPCLHWFWMAQAWTFMEAQDPTGKVVNDVAASMLRRSGQLLPAWKTQRPVDTQGMEQVTWDWAGRCAAVGNQDLWSPFMDEWRKSQPIATALPAVVWPATVTDTPHGLMNVWKVFLSRDPRLPYRDQEHATARGLLDKTQALSWSGLSAQEQATLNDLDERVAQQAPPWAPQWQALRREQMTPGPTGADRRRRLRS